MRHPLMQVNAVQVNAVQVNVTAGVVTYPAKRGRDTPVAEDGTFDESGRKTVATYELVYGDDEQVVDETLENIDHVEREDGWVVLFRGPEAILRVQESHVKSMELLD
jgi:hypothetical protein